MFPPPLPLPSMGPMLAVAIAAPVIYVVTGIAHDVARRRRARQTARLQRDLETIVLGSDEEAAATAESLIRSPSLLLDVLPRLVCDLDGDADRRLRKLVAATGLGRHIRRRVRSRSWRRRAQGAALAPLLGDDDDLRFVLLDDPHPLVRARAAESIERGDIAECVDTLVALLDDPVEAVRFSAQHALLRGDAGVVPALGSYLETSRGEGVEWALEIAANLPDARLIPAIDVHLGSELPRRRALAAEALVPWIDHSERLVDLLSDEDALVRATAAHICGTTGAQALAARVGHLLADEAWSVRHSAGQALAHMGPAGRMVLRHHLRDPDRYARDMATLMLQTVQVEGAVPPASRTAA